MPLAAAAFFLLGRGFLGAFLIMSSRDWSMSMLAAVGWGVPSALNCGGSGRPLVALAWHGPAVPVPRRSVHLPTRAFVTLRRGPRRKDGMSFFLHEILGLGDGDDRRAAARRRASKPSARGAPGRRSDGDVGASPGLVVPDEKDRAIPVAEVAAPTRPSVGANLPPPPPPIAVKKAPPASPARPPRPSPGQAVVDAIRDALAARDDDESAPNGRDDERTTGRDDDARGDERRGHFPPSHTPGGTRRHFTGVRDLLEDLRAAIDDATLMEQQHPGIRRTAMDAEIDAACRAQAASACALVWSALDAFGQTADTHQHEDQFLAHGGVELLLRTMRTFPLDPKVVSAAVGACLSLARDCPAGRVKLERVGGRKAVRAAMCAHPGVNFGGAFAGLRAWLDGEGGAGRRGSEVCDGSEGKGGTRVGDDVGDAVGDAAVEAFIRSRTTGHSGDAFDDDGAHFASNPSRRHTRGRREG